MTVKLYDTDPYLKECTAKVIKCHKAQEGYKIYLDKTIFFARGGGQPQDKGTIDGFEVLDVYEDNTGFVHLLKCQIEEGKTVKCLLDFDFRLDSMQQHLGQHIFSRIAENEFDAKTVAARIEEGASHVELDKKLDYEQMFRLEKRVNEVIKESLPVTISLHDKESAKALGLPQKAFIHDIIRVIAIEGLDINPCGGTHPKNTGEVLKCVITGTKEVRGVHRIYYKFGKRALEDGLDRFKAMMSAQDFFDIQDKSGILPSIVVLKELKDKLSFENAHLKEELTVADCQNLLNTGIDKGSHKLIVCHLNEKNYIKSAVDMAVLENNCAIMLTNRQGSSLNLILAHTKNLNTCNMGGVVREFLSKFSGKGGGGSAVAQCTVPYSDEALKYAVKLFSQNI